MSKQIIKRYLLLVVKTLCNVKFLSYIVLKNIFLFNMLIKKQNKKLQQTKEGFE